MQQSTPLPQATGASNVREEGNFIIFDKVRVPPENTNTGVELPTSDKPESKRTGRGRRRHGKLSQADVLGILKSVAFQVQESGLPCSVINLPNNSFGIVVRGAWACVKCGVFYEGINALGNVCDSCVGR
jgi:hypothetical protein